MVEGSTDIGTVAIVPLAPGHIESFHHALDLVSRERKYLSFLEAPPLDHVREFQLGRIGRGDPGCVAVVGGEVVGWCDITRHDRLIHAHRGSLGMGLLPAYRGGGLGRKLIEATLAQAREAGFVRIELSVHSDNARAISLYDKVGFVREGLQRDAVYIDGEHRDAIMMAIVERQNAAG
ncbi:N-acetyltransferase [Mesorhizobium sp. M8A.F.Ca.ET.208.01.1.1]|uniref:GNAT family N-acetyltransferase n=1 Tax=unclassified Mesorhizobium TaxID=325217 RepID=UPI0010938FDE|nr:MULTISPECIES: GNAT family protein [unclassified Mesorhizobium]TGQ93010.1 N-acetyltransferase [Mesorhizobium sp. M8A.F.Ca.ET.208.01.1.1]TGT52913.1 N-acetyltransferase [Mesorhizobium sp. M8A.F.Ca.ET.167.01.1.1]